MIMWSASLGRKDPSLPRGTKVCDFLRCRWWSPSFPSIPTLSCVVCSYLFLLDNAQHLEFAFPSINYRVFIEFFKINLFVGWADSICFGAAWTTGFKWKPKSTCFWRSLSVPCQIPQGAVLPLLPLALSWAALPPVGRSIRWINLPPNFVCLLQHKIWWCLLLLFLSPSIFTAYVAQCQLPLTSLLSANVTPPLPAFFLCFPSWLLSQVFFGSFPLWQYFFHFLSLSLSVSSSSGFLHVALCPILTRCHIVWQLLSYLALSGAQRLEGKMPGMLKFCLK